MTTWTSFLSKVPCVQTGAQYHWGTLGRQCRTHLRVSHLRGEQSGVFSTNFQALLAEGCFQGCELPDTFSLPDAQADHTVNPKGPRDRNTRRWRHDGDADRC